MRPAIRELRALQLAVAIACLVPLGLGTASVIRGVAVIKGVALPPLADLDSHFRYLSGIFLALGVGFATCIRRIAAKGPRFRMLGAMVIAGGLARLISLLTIGPPTRGHLLGLGMELLVVPLLMLWQRRIERRRGRG